MGTEQGKLLGARRPAHDGPSAGMHCPPAELDAMLDEYYALRGWDGDGVPTPARLSTLGL